MSALGRKADRPLLGSQTALADIPDAAALSQKGWWIGKAGSERARQRQNVIAGQGRQRHPGCRNAIDSDSFLDLRSRGRGVPHPHMKDFGFDGMIGFIRSRREVAAKMACIAVNQRQPNLLVQLAAKRADGVSPSSIFPPACMNHSVPALRTSSKRPAPSSISAAAIQIVREDLLLLPPC